MKKKSGSYALVLLLAIFVPILIVIVILSTNNKTDLPRQLTNNEQLPQIPNPTVAQDPENMTYENKAFTFKYSPQFEMNESSESGVSWIDRSANFSMELAWQSTPFSKALEVNRKVNSKDIKIAQDKEIVVSTNKVRDIVYDCGENCLYHELQIQSGDNFYRLRASTAGGHEPKFQQIIASLKFIN